jgi:hypothetical protein
LSRALTTATAFIATGLFAPPLNAQSLPFSGGAWELRGDSSAVVVDGGREELRMQTGLAYMRDVRLQDGTIDVDVMVTRRRSFVYLMFRMQDDREYEEVYLRPHKSSLPDAVQYAPVYQGQSAWQLFHGASGTTATNIEPGVWTRLRLVVAGSRAALFLGDTVRPVMVIQELAREPRAGYIALRGFLPAGVPGSGPIVRFSNVRVQPGVIAYTFPAAPLRPDIPGVITAWEIGDAFTAPDSALMYVRPEWVRNMTRIGARPGGLVELNRHVKLPAAPGDAGAVARVRIIAEAEGVRRLDLGFSDIATVLLNGRPIIRLDQSFNYEGRRDGLIGFHQATVYLPLRAGSNELAVILLDRFGGWGLMGRLPDERGLRIEPD